MDAITAIKDAAKTCEDRKNIIELIALRKLGIRTLETRNSDRLDFHDLSVESIKEALETAMKAGIEIGLTIDKGAMR